ncbi:ABC transporter ATP-binding protein [Zavarzinia compransoris]|uniref:ABC transporter ATP-binding protein n=1 Tax=Zavarzinia compransoris TaxID=1264899 RepID=A0A317E2Z5_9PROT|nr:ABC transporter ATP-binding protein [Zavarzinia compransoris]PWR21001.1 ABC transporter ATP-binding protein [Zavarzinia compransoris]TDP44033.1 amino acid/amide ABC transporter ATP-binding protein 2 (HAAT family) [Zavarzinia compransoris]
MSLLELDGVDAAYGRARVLHDVSLAVSRGERVAILGRNGVGKTTVVNTCLGLAALKKGHVAFGGKRVGTIRTFSAARAGLSVVPQGRRIVPGLTVRENLHLGAAPNRKGPWTVEAVFGLFPILRERAETPGTAMSGGQQQMLAIGRALMANPDLLILDEPSEGLAPVVVDELGDNLVKLADAGTSILLIEQNFGLVRKVAERYYVLSKGAVVEAGQLAGLSMESLKKHVAV